MSKKDLAQTLQESAKIYGNHKINRTHAYEILAKLDGFRNRHAYLSDPTKGHSNNSDTNEKEFWMLMLGDTRKSACLTEEELKRVVLEHLPKFDEIANTDADFAILHQDAFAADYQIGELLLLGMAIKFLGISGKTVHTHGKNKETLTPSDK